MRMFIRVFTVLALCCGLLTLSAQAANDGAVTLSEGLKEIEAEAFAGNAGMTSLVIPKTVNSIGSRAFASCTGLREVYLGKNTSLKIAADAFAGCGDIHFNAYPDTPGELFALAHGYRCDRLEDGSPFLERALQLVTQNGGTMSILQSADFSTRRLVVRMEGDRLPDISAYKPTKIVHKQEDGIYFVQFATVQDTVDCYGLLKNREGSDVIFVEPDACVEVIDDVEAVGTVSGKAWDTDDPMGFDVYAPYVSENSSGKVTIAIIDSGVKRLSAYSGMLRADGVNLVSDGKSWSEDGMVHGSMIAGIIHDCVGTNNVDILPIRVVSGGNVADCSMIALGIDYAVERGADIINLSLNFDENEYVRYAIGKALDAGIRVVVAAGNSHRLIDKVFPANVPGTTVVSGIDSDYRLSGSSNYGANVSYCAPDTDVVSTAYASMTRKGTSFSAPMVASALALAKLDSTHTESDLRTVCRQLTPVVNGENNYGNGLMQLDKLTNEDITIKYDANGGENAPAFQIKVPGISILLTEEEPTRNYRVTLDDGTGNTTELLVAAAFSGWNTSANGSGTSYAPGANYIREESVTLYAQWEGGSLKDLPTPTREGYRFEGWYTAATGGSLVTRQNVITRNVTLYAHWTKLKTYTVSYDANGGTGAPGSQIKWEGVDLPLSTAKPTRGYTVTMDFNDGTGNSSMRIVSAVFDSWNTRADGTGKRYSSGGVYKEDEPARLFAQWQSGAMGALPTRERIGYRLDGWFTSASGGTAVTASTAVSGDMTIYAHWSKTYSVTYRAAGASNLPETQIKVEDEALTLSSRIPVRTFEIHYSYDYGSPEDKTFNYAFDGWSDTATGTTYSAGQTYTANGALSLEAQWSIPQSLESSILFEATRVGFIFQGWYAYDSSGKYTLTSISQITPGMRLYAQWEAIPITVSFNESTGTLTVSGGGEMDGDTYNTIRGYKDSNVKKVVISEGITTIRNSVFSSFTALQQVVIPNSVTKIEYAAFDYCLSLPSVSLPESVETIDTSAFSRCNSLTSVYIPKNVIDCSEAFMDCAKLQSIDVSPLNEAFSSENGILYNKEKTALCTYPAGKTASSVTVRSSVLYIGSFAFEGCANIRSVSLPDTLKEIGWSAFHGCSALEGISIPDSVTKVDGYAFVGCRNLTWVKLPKNLTSIEYMCFYSCSSLSLLNVPDSVTSIGFGALPSGGTLTLSGSAGSYAQTYASNNGIPFIVVN